MFWSAPDLRTVEDSVSFYSTTSFICIVGNLKLNAVRKETKQLARAHENRTLQGDERTREHSMRIITLKMCFWTSNPLEIFPGVKVR